MFIAAAILGLSLAQTAPATAATTATATPAAAPAAAAPLTADQRADRAAEAAEKAAEAAVKAAQAAASAAQVAQSLASKPAAPPPPPPAAAPAASPWSGTVSLGLISLTGNTRSITFTGNVVAERKTQGWIFGVKANGTYGESRAEDASAGTVLAESAAAQVRGDRRFTEKVSGYLLGGSDTDHVKSIEYRVFGEAGTGLIWFDQKRPDGSQSFLRTDLGVRYTRESDFQYFPTVMDLPDQNLVLPRLAGEFRYGVTKDLLFLQTAEVLTNVTGESRTLVNSLSKVSVRLVGSLAIGASFTVTYDSAPAEGKLPTDTALAANLDYAI